MCVYAWFRVLLDCPHAVLASWCMLLGITSPPLLALYVCTQWGCTGSDVKGLWGSGVRGGGWTPNALVCDAGVVVGM